MNNISIELQGGLGNQLFQIFTSIQYAKDHDKTVLFPYLKYIPGKTPRSTYWITLFRELKTTKADLNYKVYKEPTFEYQPIPYFEDNISLNGYFQSYKYFNENIKNIIHTKEKAEEIKNNYEHNCDTSIHFRIGDYKGQEENHPILPYEYYKKAIQTINSTKILYFCEKQNNQEVQEIVKNLSNELQIEFIKANDDIPDWQQMLLMSTCKNNIIANSTFSWWAAYLNEHLDKKITYPEMWFGPSLKLNTKDMFPESWNQISILK